MHESQADKLIERLKSACTFHRFDEPGVYAEYSKFFMRYDFHTMAKVVDWAIEADSRNVPPISTLAKSYNKHKEVFRRKDLVRNEEYCPVCDDKGFIIMKEKDPLSGYIYDYVLYCPFCPVGRAQAYNGMECENKSLYMVPPITKYFDEQAVQLMREENLKRRAVKGEATQKPLKGQLQKVGRSIPDGWQYGISEEELPW